MGKKRKGSGQIWCMVVLLQFGKIDRKRDFLIIEKIEQKNKELNNKVNENLGLKHFFLIFSKRMKVTM